MTIQTRLLTADDLWNMPGNGDGYELVRGELVQMAPAGQEHSHIALGLASRIYMFVQAHGLGKATGADGGYRLSTNPDTLYAPDIGFVQTSRLVEGKTTSTFFPGAPDLAVEVVSPHDVYAEVEDKIGEYLEAGTRLVWLVIPRRKIVRVFRADGSEIRLRLGDTLSGEDVLPGFSTPVADIFES